VNASVVRNEAATGGQPRQRGSGVWLVFHPNRTHPLLDPVRSLERFPSISVTCFEIATRYRRRAGRPRYVHQATVGEEICRGVDQHAYVSVWFARRLRAQEEPDVSSTPHEEWTFGPHGGLIRQRLS